MINRKLLICWVIMLIINLYNMHINVSEDILFNIWSSNSEINIENIDPDIQEDTNVNVEEFSNEIVPLYKHKYYNLKSRINTSLDRNKYRFKENIKSIVNNPSQYIQIKVDEANLSNTKLSFWSIISKLKKN